MSDGTSVETGDLPAGGLSEWLDGLQAGLRGEAGSDVPCGVCTACCRSSQFVHIGPDETDTLAHVPVALTFPAPQMPRGHVLMDYDTRGRCPMLTDSGCSIYEHRPRTCRTYDCRVFAATDVELDDAGKASIAERVRRWRFDSPSAEDDRARQALRAAVRFLRDHPDLLPEGSAPETPTRLAVMAVEIVAAFLDREAGTVDGTAEAVRAALTGERER